MIRIIGFGCHEEKTPDEGSGHISLDIDYIHELNGQPIGGIRHMSISLPGTGGPAEKGLVDKIESLVSSMLQYLEGAVETELQKESVQLQGFRGLINNISTIKRVMSKT